MTVKELMEHCKHQIEVGNGNKNIVISDDEEGNGYHSLFYPFFTDPAMVRDVIEETGSMYQIIEDIDDIIILG